MIDFEKLNREGKTIIYKETESNEQPEGWDFWGEARTPEEHKYVWRKIVTFEEAKQYELESAYLTNRGRELNEKEVI